MKPRACFQSGFLLRNPSTTLKTRPSLHSKRGQAVIEYVLMVLVAMSMVFAFNYGLRNVALKLWMQMTCEVTAPCPHCPTPESVKNAANRLASGSCR